MWALLSFVLSQITHLTYGQTDGQTGRRTDSFLVVRRRFACNACSAVTEKSQYIHTYRVA